MNVVESGGVSAVESDEGREALAGVDPVEMVEVKEAVPEKIQYGSMVAERDPNLPPWTKLEYPYDQRVAFVKERWTNGEDGIYPTLDDA